MKKSYLVLEFNGCRTTIELLDTPIAKRWARAYSSNINLGLFDLMPKVNAALIHIEENDLECHSEYNISAKYCCEQINIAIEDAEKNIQGAGFPYRAFEGMSFKDTNFIHRCFTTAAATNTNWVHNIDNSELLKFKKIQYENPDHIITLIRDTQFKVINYDLYIDALHRINKWVHRYESFLMSSNTTSTIAQIQDDTSHIILDWDNFNSSHVQIGTIGSRTTYKEICNSIPDNYDEYNVFLGKFILGKDYETSFSEHDNPLEFDTTNVDGIVGIFRIHTSDNLKKLYTDSNFTKWAKSAGLTEELFLPPPIGKVIENDCDFSKLEPNYISNERWTCGSSKPYPPFNYVKSYIVEK